MVAACPGILLRTKLAAVAAYKWPISSESFSLGLIVSFDCQILVFGELCYTVHLTAPLSYLFAVQTADVRARGPASILTNCTTRSSDSLYYCPGRHRRHMTVFDSKEVAVKSQYSDNPHNKSFAMDMSLAYASEMSKDWMGYHGSCQYANLRPISAQIKVTRSTDIKAKERILIPRLFTCVLKSHQHECVAGPLHTVATNNFTIHQEINT